MAQYAWSMMFHEVLKRLLGDLSLLADYTLTHEKPNRAGCRIFASGPLGSFKLRMK
jgi:hypothetical protein